MARKKNKKRSARRAINRLKIVKRAPKRVRRVIRKATKDNRITKKEYKKIARVSKSSKGKSNTRKLLKRIDRKADKTKAIKSKPEKDRLLKIVKSTKPGKDTTSSGSSSGGGGGNRGSGGDGKKDRSKKDRKRDLFTKGGKVKPDALEGDYGSKDFARREEKLKKRGKAYETMYGGKTGKSQKFLKDLADQATTRMKIKPREYGRGGKDLSLAEQYDRNPEKLKRALSNPMNEFMKRQAKKYDKGDGPMSYLRNFRNKGNPEFAEFNASRMQKFARSGLTGGGKSSRKMKKLAKTLGISNRRFKVRRSPDKVFAGARNKLQRTARRNNNLTLSKSKSNLGQTKAMSGLSSELKKLSKQLDKAV